MMHFSCSFPSCGCLYNPKSNMAKFFPVDSEIGLFWDYSEAFVCLSGGIVSASLVSGVCSVEAGAAALRTFSSYTTPGVEENKMYTSVLHVTQV